MAYIDVLAEAERVLNKAFETYYKEWPNPKIVAEPTVDEKGGPMVKVHTNMKAIDLPDYQTGNRRYFKWCRSFETQGWKRDTKDTSRFRPKENAI